MSERYHGSHGSGGLKVKGTFWMSGPQPVGKGGVPEEVAALFRAFPTIQMVALEMEEDGRKSSSVYQRMGGKP